VLQEEVMAQAQQIKVRGTTKAAVLEGDESCPNIVAVLVSDTMPVHFCQCLVELLSG
jgi:hypothetical protein